jgi:hypothetical protein
MREPWEVERWARAEQEGSVYPLSRSPVNPTRTWAGMPSIRMHPPSILTGKLAIGSDAGGRTTAPVLMSNPLPWK